MIARTRFGWKTGMMIVTLALAALPSPATAYSSTSSGLVGELSYSETTTTPIGTCGYAGPAWRDDTS